MIGAAFDPAALAARGERYFKFIGGANLRDAALVTRLAAYYALAGAHLFDVAAEPDIVEAAFAGVRQARQWLTERPAWLLTAFGERPLPEPGALPATVMVSITLAGDRHTEIAVVAEDFCTRCDVCTPICPPGAIVNGDVRAEICTGCGLCVSVCPPAVIDLLPRAQAYDLDALWAAGARALEIHTGAADAREIQAVGLPLASRWRALGGLLAYSIDGHQLGHRGAISLAKRLSDPETIIQADGKPISGTSGLRSTVPCVRLARAMARAGVPGYIQVSGGTNDRTGELLSRYGVPAHGVGMGSVARSALKPLDDAPDDPAVRTRALMAALRLVESTQV